MCELNRQRGLVLGVLLLPWMSAAQVQTSTGRNAMDATTWVRLFVNAAQPYPTAAGTTITPQFGIECSQKAGKESINVLLFSGAGITGRPTGYNPDGRIRYLRVKLDDAKPTTLNWVPLPDGVTFMFHGTIAPKKTVSGFVKDILKSRTVLIEFNPYMSAGVITAEFDVRGMSSEFAKHPECSAR